MCSAWVCSLNRISTDFGVLCVIAGNLRGQKRRQGGAASFSTWRWTHFCNIGFRPGTICGKLSYLCFLEKPRFVVNLWQDKSIEESENPKKRWETVWVGGTDGQVLSQSSKYKTCFHTLACITHIDHCPSLSDNVKKIPGFIKILLI